MNYTSNIYTGIAIHKIIDIMIDTHKRHDIDEIVFDIQELSKIYTNDRLTETNHCML